MLPDANASSLAIDRTGAPTLEQSVRDLLASPMLDAHSIMLDKTATDSRAVIDCVATLIAPCATQHGTCLIKCAHRFCDGGESISRRPATRPTPFLHVASCCPIIQAC
ncbi:MAG: hypothetical protein CPDRYDRY_3210 [uncultured Paraburkholderia sp.]|nr:MAG: hypothetical protein CPDRYDRY_3210 [uncultured Paraburkholderia sp.]